MIEIYHCLWPEYWEDNLIKIKKVIDKSNRIAMVMGKIRKMYNISKKSLCKCIGCKISELRY